jgi:hypothetical protein
VIGRSGLAACDATVCVAARSSFVCKKSLFAERKEVRVLEFLLGLQSESHSKFGKIHGCRIEAGDE